MKIKKIKFVKYNSADIAYLIVLFLYATVMVLNESNFSESDNFGSIVKFLKYIVLVFAVTYFLLSYTTLKINKKVLLIFGILIGLNIISFIFSGVEINILLILLMTLASTHAKLKNVIITYMFGFIIGCCIVFYCASIGIIADAINNRYSADILSSFFLKSNFYTRHSFGFIHSNQVPFALMTTYFLIIFWKQDKLSWIIHAAIEVLNVYIFIYCGSRFVFSVIALTTVVCIANSITHKISWALPKWCAYIYFGMAIFSLSLILFYNRIPAAFNIFLNFRISNAYKVIQTYGFHIIKSNFTAGTDYGINGTIIDNGYLMLFMQRGLLFGIAILALWTHICKSVVNNNNKYIFLILLMIAIENFIDYQIISYKFLPLLCIAVHENDDFLTKR